MWPWGHVAVGYLLWSGSARHHGDVPGDHGTLVLVVATLFPDLVDKPLAWTFGVLATGRSLAHSALTATLACLVVWVLLDGSDHRRLVLPFALGYWSHLFADALGPVIGGEFGDLVYLGWPLTPEIDPETARSFQAHLLGVEMTPMFALQLVLVVLAAVAWHRDGLPGFGVIGRRVVPERVRKSESH